MDSTEEEKKKVEGMEEGEETPLEMPEEAPMMDAPAEETPTEEEAM